MEKREVTVRIGGQSCSFYSDDQDAYIEELADRANAALMQVNGSSAKAVLWLTDQLMRLEKEKAPRPETAAETAAAEIRAEGKAETEAPPDGKAAAKAEEQPKRAKKNTPKSAAETGQVSVWDLL